MKAIILAAILFVPVVAQAECTVSDGPTMTIIYCPDGKTVIRKNWDGSISGNKGNTYFDQKTDSKGVSVTTVREGFLERPFGKGQRTIIALPDGTSIESKD